MWKLAVAAGYLGAGVLGLALVRRRAFAAGILSVLTAGGLLINVGTASADSYTFSESVSVPPDPDQSNNPVFFNLPAYDFSLGTVTSARVTLSGQVTPDVSGYATYPIDALPAQVSLTPEVRLDNVEDYLTTQIVMTTALGNGESFSLSADVPLGTLSSPFVSVSDFTQVEAVGPGIFIRDQLYDATYLGGTLAITYTYTPVPEPGSSALLGGAILGMALFTSRRHRPARGARGRCRAQDRGNVGKGLALTFHHRLGAIAR